MKSGVLQVYFSDNSAVFPFDRLFFSAGFSDGIEKTKTVATGDAST
jgi:hypothetical protein